MADYKLTYFALTGRAEPIRFLMKYGNIQFEDVRFEFDQWPKIKPTMKFGEVPVLTHNGSEYNQSVAICRYMAKKVKLVGSDDLENMEIDSIVDTVADLTTKLATWFWDPSEESKKLKKDALLNETVPFYLERLDKIVEKNNGYLACKKLTWADLFFVPAIQVYDHYTSSDSICKYKNLDALRAKVLAIPNIKKWIEQRPKTAF